MKFGKTPDAVGKYRLSKAAEEDLIGIALFGDANFGIAQSTGGLLYVLYYLGGELRVNRCKPNYR